MQTAAEISELFEQVHEAPGDPEPVGAGDDKIVDVCFFVRAAFGQRTGNEYAADKGELEEQAGSFLCDGEQDVGAPAVVVPSVCKCRIILQRIERSGAEEATVFDKGI